ncbi:CamS family sex pheromone protein [Evansella tamaricis]|uniref:CamS family sex pheromone protein n=1 Tax=Evansella tamaricis TaxID=2069301 RepID=A0ABS6J967_9BACI|nr:CamS family sex pheromone protein [Evansella tamaricis]MBU9710232.1 CamS family sex pheromone protein [Evansella tamaricis]
MKRRSMICMAILLFLTGCVPTLDRGEEEIIIVEETDEMEEQQFIITPTIDTPENFYRNVLDESGTYLRSQARGVVAHAMNNRIDINQFEVGLMEIASANFDQSEFYFREGSYLTGETINRWLRRFDPEDQRNTDGLNPPLAEGESDEDQMRENPLVLSNVLEHNYFYGSAEEGVNLGGVVVGLALRSVYYFRTEVVGDDGIVRYHFHEETLDLDEVEEQGKEIAQEVVERLRGMAEELREVPITVALYQEEPRGSIVPGSFIAMTQLGEGETMIGEWEAINEQFLFFPSRAARDAYPNQSNVFSQFKTEVEDFFGRSMGVVGKGRYKNDTLEELSIEFNLQSHGKAEIIALTQFISGRVSENFSSDVPVYVYVNSINGPESIIVQYPENEPHIHIYK